MLRIAMYRRFAQSSTMKMDIAVFLNVEPHSSRLIAHAYFPDCGKLPALQDVASNA